MHIGFITSEYPHAKVKNAAGIATSIKNLALALTKKGVKVTIFVYHQNEDEVFLDDAVEIHLIKTKTYRLFTWYFYRKYLQNYINTIVDKNRINILEAPDWTGITAFMKFKTPLLIRFHGSDAYFCKLEGRKQKFKNFVFEKTALKNATAYITPTTFAGEQTRKIFSINKNKIKTIHYGLQLEHFINESPKDFNENTILYIGTIIRKKGILELAEIFNTVVEKKPKAKLILIGGDSPDIKTGNSSTFNIMKSKLSENAKKQTQYLGKIPYAEVKQHIKKAHICVFPSFAETLGMVTIESMALQKPVVNTSIGWAKELVDDGVNGFLVHPSNINEYANTILKLLDNMELCFQIGKEARKKVEQNFDIVKNAEVNIEYYKRFIKK